MNPNVSETMNALAHRLRSQAAKADKAIKVDLDYLATEIEMREFSDDVARRFDAAKRDPRVSQAVLQAQLEIEERLRVSAFGRVDDFLNAIIERAKWSDDLDFSEWTDEDDASVREATQ